MRAATKVGEKLARNASSQHHQPSLRRDRGRRVAPVSARNLWCYAALLASGGIYAAFAASFFPSPPGLLGHDYSYFLPMLLAGKYWIAQNGVFAVPHFSPAFCAGLPFLAHPASIFYSVPQALAEFVDPLTSFFATTVLFAWLGGLGTFLLLRVRLAASAPAACLGAVIFLFNGFLLYRMAIGHAAYHAVGLLPLLCHVLLTPLAGYPDRRWRFAIASALGGTMLAYFVYAGAVTIIISLTISVLAVALLHALVRRPAEGSFFLVGAGAGLLAGLAAAAKLVPGLVMVATFPRTVEQWIFPDFASALSWLIRALFLPWTIPEFLFRHELELGLGPVPLLLLIGGGCAAIARGALRRRYDRRSWVTAIALAAVLAVPLWLSFGGPHFAAWLESLPYIREKALLIRLFFVYLLPVTIGAALMLDLLFADPRARSGAALIGMLATVVPAVLADTTHYRQQPYDPGSFWQPTARWPRPACRRPLSPSPPAMAGGSSMMAWPTANPPFRATSRSSATRWKASQGRSPRARSRFRGIICAIRSAIFTGRRTAARRATALPPRRRQRRHPLPRTGRFPIGGLGGRKRPISLR